MKSWFEEKGKSSFGLANVQSSIDGEVSLELKSGTPISEAFSDL